MLLRFVRSYTACASKPGVATVMMACAHLRIIAGPSTCRSETSRAVHVGIDARVGFVG